MYGYPFDDLARPAGGDQAAAHSGHLSPDLLEFRPDLIGDRPPAFAQGRHQSASPEEIPALG
jgi:hypothetical protein